MFSNIWSLILLLKVQFPQHVQKVITVVDSKLLLLNHPPALTTGCVWQLRLCQWPCELSQRCCEGGCWNAKACVSSTAHATLSTAAHLRYNSQACISWERSWTSSMVYLYRDQSLSDCCSDVELCREGACWSDPWKTNKPQWLTRHPTEGEGLSQGLIQSDIFVLYE